MKSKRRSLTAEDVRYIVTDTLEQTGLDKVPKRLDKLDKISDKISKIQEHLHIAI